MTTYDDHSLPAPSARAIELHGRMVEFMCTEVLPGEQAYPDHRRAGGSDDHALPLAVEELKAKTRELGLWNLFLPPAGPSTGGAA